LSEIHAASHPARLERRQGAQVGADGIRGRPGAENPAAALLAALDDEIEEE